MRAPCCNDDRERRGAVRKEGLTGFDWIEVDGSQTELSIAFIGEAPSWIGPEHLHITGGRRERDIVVVDIQVEPSREDDLDDIMIVRVDRPGDYSTYRLEVVALDERGRPTGRTPNGFDPRYTGIDFSFKADCPIDQDPAAHPSCPAPAVTPAAISYLAKDYQSFRQLMLDRMALTAPGWTERRAPDLGITLVEVLAYAADDLSYYQDAVATEAFLDTARKRESVRRHARLVDYRLDEGCAAQGWAQLTLAGAKSHVIDAGGMMFTTALSGMTPPVAKADDVRFAEDVLVFEPEAGVGTIALWASHNRIEFHDWGGSECCIPAGATRATLLDPGKLPEHEDKKGSKQGSAAEGADRRMAVDEDERDRAIREGRWHELRLKPGDVLIFAEVRGPRTGRDSDADPEKRHAVRLTSVGHSWDPVSRELTVEIAWCSEDALPFALCLSTRTDPPDCRTICHVSAALGNIVPIDHGRSFKDPLVPVLTASTEELCDEPCKPAEVLIVARRYRPRLPRGAPAFIPAPTDIVPDACGCGSRAASFRGAAGASPALPAVSLHSSPRIGGIDQQLLWSPRADLLDSTPDERHFVVEPDDEGGASLRFGDGILGRAPGAGEAFVASYRIGGGSRGNIGADKLRHILFCRDAAFQNGIELTVGNPLPMHGGRDPESVASAKLRAPTAYRRRIERAITAEDYAAVVMRDFPARVQRAAAKLRSTGVRIEVQVAIDAIGRFEADADLLRGIERHLERFRRIEHDVRVVRARYVPIDLALEVCTTPYAIAEDVGRRVRERLGTGLGGFFHVDALSFGDGIALSRIFSAVHEVPGVAHVHAKVLNRLHEASDGELTSGLLPIAADEIARLDQDKDEPENGRLVLELKGDR